VSLNHGGTYPIGTVIPIADVVENKN